MMHADRMTHRMPASMKALADIAPSALYGEATEVRDAASSFNLQLDAALVQYLDRVRSHHYRPDVIEEKGADFLLAAHRLNDFCESPIERQMVPWLLVQNYGPFKSLRPIVHVPKDEDEFPSADLVLVPQFAFARFRMDFALIAKFEEHMKIVAIECDGRGYHDKEKDIRRDQYLAGWQIPTVRATGREIYLNPQYVGEMVARQIIDWAHPLGMPL